MNAMNAGSSWEKVRVSLNINNDGRAKTAPAQVGRTGHGGPLTVESKPPLKDQRKLKTKIKASERFVTRGERTPAVS